MLVTIITPTTPDRAAFNERIKTIVQYQDYPNIEHLLDYEAGNIGTKRNRLCERAKGDVIIHMDSDDIYAPDWVSRCVEELTDRQCTGLRKCYYHDVVNDRGWLYSYPEVGMLYMPEATLSYRKQHWHKYGHSDTHTGECKRLYYGAKPHNYINGFIATIHGGNTSSRVNGKYWQSIDVNIVKQLYTK